jgi:hypothetical protein
MHCKREEKRENNTKTPIQTAKAEARKVERRRRYEIGPF